LDCADPECILSGSSGQRRETVYGKAVKNLEISLYPCPTGRIGPSYGKGYIHSADSISVFRVCAQIKLRNIDRVNPKTGGNIVVRPTPLYICRYNPKNLRPLFVISTLSLFVISTEGRNL